MGSVREEPIREEVPEETIIGCKGYQVKVVKDDSLLSVFLSKDGGKGWKLIGEVTLGD